MSKPKPSTVTCGPDGATPVGPITLSGIVKTTKGWAVATVVLSTEEPPSIKFGVSHAFKEFAAREHRGTAQAQANRA